MNRVVIVDYGMCNLDSVKRAVEECGAQAHVSDETADLARADRIILPGVGAFPDAMRNLRQRRLDIALDEEVLGAGAPFLGICLGMQLMAAVGYEGQETPGLGWIPGTVRRFEPTEADRRVPHIGWNEVYPANDSPLFVGIEPGTDFYFVHSYHFDSELDGDRAATTPYCGRFVSAVGHDLVWGVQFHPEKSQQAGFRLLQNFLRL